MVILKDLVKSLVFVLLKLQLVGKQNSGHFEKL